MKSWLKQLLTPAAKVDNKNQTTKQTKENLAEVVQAAPQRQGSMGVKDLVAMEAGQSVHVCLPTILACRSLRELCRYTKQCHPRQDVGRYACVNLGQDADGYHLLITAMPNE